MRPFARRRYWISSLQGRLLVLNLLYVFVSLATICFAVLAPVVIRVRDTSVSVLDKHDAAYLLHLHEHLWPVVPALFVLLAIHSLLVSHRIAGPLYRFRAIFKSVAAGDLAPRTDIRERDFLWPEAHALSEMVTALNSRIGHATAQHRQVRSAVDRLERALEEGSKEETERAIESLKEQLQQLEALLDQFKTDSVGPAPDEPLEDPPGPLPSAPVSGTVGHLAERKGGE